MKRWIGILLYISVWLSPIFAKTYSEYLAEAKEYESQKRWCYALGAYYDAMGTDEKYEDKTEAVNRYKILANAIISGKPGLQDCKTMGLGSFHDEWRNLLLDAEKYGSSICVYDITVGDLKKEKQDSYTRNVTYSAALDYKLSDRYEKTIAVVQEGLEKVYDKHWWDIPDGWPVKSAGVFYNACHGFEDNGILIYSVIFGLEHYGYSGDAPSVYYEEDYYEQNFNAFMAREVYQYADWLSPDIGTLYKLKFNIRDIKGNNLIEDVEVCLGEDEEISFTDISSEIINLIDNKKASINLVACSLKYGYTLRGPAYFSEKKLPIENIVCISKNKKSKIAENVFCAMIKNDMVNISDINMQIMKTEVTQNLYEEVMEENPSHFEGTHLPVECVSLYDAIYFCNKLSEMTGLTPVYSVNGSTNVEYWNYTPHQGDSITATINENNLADGFRLPSIEEWQYAAKGGEWYAYSGSDDCTEVAWCKSDGNFTHCVAAKKSNGYGLYDMSGNVCEWTFGSDYIFLGGSYYDENYNCVIDSGGSCKPSERYCNLGFRIVCICKD